MLSHRLSPHHFTIISALSAAAKHAAAAYRRIYYTYVEGYTACCGFTSVVGMQAQNRTLRDSERYTERERQREGLEGAPGLRS